VRPVSHGRDGARNAAYRVTGCVKGGSAGVKGRA
jgi:hypothetical protein